MNMNGFTWTITNFWHRRQDFLGQLNGKTAVSKVHAQSEDLEALEKVQRRSRDYLKGGGEGRKKNMDMDFYLDNFLLGAVQYGNGEPGWMD